MTVLFSYSFIDPCRGSIYAKKGVQRPTISTAFVMNANAMFSVKQAFLYPPSSELARCIRFGWGKRSKRSFSRRDNMDSNNIHLNGPITRNMMKTRG